MELKQHNCHKRVPSKLVEVRLARLIHKTLRSLLWRRHPKMRKPALREAIELLAVEDQKFKDCELWEDPSGQETIESARDYELASAGTGHIDPLMKAPNYREPLVRTHDLVKAVDQHQPKGTVRRRIAEELCGPRLR
ncbi:hypothetical protein ONA91_34180 [Micromonospora sp. DR5-3]|uniref:hypothetical protein n=1 Tax=unclassified Micromonospora TaxID=2617518 RepID=UPI0021076F26|nr:MULTISPECIES: hypothetical protein [unclassified Micromonospora]MCW3819502.1 hypothetical protein [Micromonospora sp. DR5-3]